MLSSVPAPAGRRAPLLAGTLVRLQQPRAPPCCCRRHAEARDTVGPAGDGGLPQRGSADADEGEGASAQQQQQQQEQPMASTSRAARPEGGLAGPGKARNGQARPRPLSALDHAPPPRLSPPAKIGLVAYPLRTAAPSPRRRGERPTRTPGAQDGASWSCAPRWLRRGPPLHLRSAPLSAGRPRPRPRGCSVRRHRRGRRRRGAMRSRRASARHPTAAALWGLSALVARAQRRAKTPSCRCRRP